MNDPKFDDDMLNGQNKKYATDDPKVIQGDVLDKEEKLTGLFSTIEKLKPYWEDFKTIFSMLKDWVSGDYREVPVSTIASLAGVLLYVLSPFDLIFDAIPLLGFMDDAAVLALAIKMAGSDIEAYRQWKRGNESSKGR